MSGAGRSDAEIIQDRIDLTVRSNSDLEDHLYAVLMELRRIRTNAIAAAAQSAGAKTLTPANISAMIDNSLRSLGFPGLGDRVYADFDERETQRIANQRMLPGNLTVYNQYYGNQ